MQLSPAIRFLVAPLETAPLLLIGTFSILLVLAYSAGLFGIWLALLLLAGFFNYSFVLLDGVAAGVEEPPVMSIEMMNPISGLRSLLLLAILVGVFFVADAAGGWLGPIVGALLGMACALTLPAVVAVQGATGSLLQSLNLGRCWRLILRLGGDYVLIVLCATLFWIMGYLVMRSQLGASLPLVLRVALLMYGWLATFALIGGVLFERRAEIGLDDAHTPEWADPETDEDKDVNRLRDQQVDRIYAEWRGGAHANAWRSVSAHLQQSAEPMAELRWMYERIARWPDPLLANRLAQEFLPLLLGAHRNGEALDVARERLKAYPDFRLTAGIDMIRLARLAREAGDRPAARALLRNFKQFYPGDPLQSVADDLLEQLAR